MVQMVERNGSLLSVMTMLEPFDERWYLALKYLLYVLGAFFDVWLSN